MKLDQIGSYVSEIQPSGTVLVVTDQNVAGRYLDRCRDSLEEAGFRTESYILPPGEDSKNGTNYLKILEYMASVPLTRSDGIAALGGGMVGDIAGFAGATYMRGINVYQIPTTLLAAVDSSVGGKTAIDLSAGKNMAGAFHQPELVLQDTDLLGSLPEAVFREGMAEVIKYGAIEDERFFEELSDPGWVIQDLEYVIRTCVDIKTRYVRVDEKDNGLRHVLNFGHTLGHAIEALSGYQLSHGDSVAKGMYWMTMISEREGWSAPGTLRRLSSQLERYGFDLTIPEDKDAVYEVLCSDKKREGNRIRIVTLDRIGQSQIRNMELREVKELL